MANAQYDRWKERMDKKVYEIAKIQPILFRDPLQPQTHYREWKYAIQLKLQAFEVAEMLEQPMDACITALFRQYDTVNQPTPAQTADTRGFFKQIDIAIQSFLLLSLPQKMIQDNDSYINVVQAKNPAHGVAFAVFSRINTQLSHKVEAEKEEYLNQLNYHKQPTDEMSSYIGIKQKARAILDERFENPIRDSMQRSFLILGLSHDNTMKTLHDHLKQQINQSLADTITAMEVYAREKLSASANQKSAFLTNAPRRKPPSESSDGNGNICRDFARQGCSRGDTCTFQHIPGNQVKRIPCKFALQCRLFAQGKCPFQHPATKQPTLPTKMKALTVSTTDAANCSGNGILRAEYNVPCANPYTLTEEEDTNF